ncbi:DUF4190 domain-containing protein [Streptomyces sp. NPDC058291]|uniref:DUF4190 domain-containing protein n=1 Tax=Streptomyces sp. NPDC058291 TaxID=3346427 RepID=UPI0036E05CE3
MSDEAPTPTGDAARSPWPAPASDGTDGPRDGVAEAAQDATRVGATHPPAPDGPGYGAAWPAPASDVPRDAAVVPSRAAWPAPASDGTDGPRDAVAGVPSAEAAQDATRVGAPYPPVPDGPGAGAAWPAPASDVPRDAAAWPAPASGGADGVAGGGVSGAAGGASPWAAPGGGRPAGADPAPALPGQGSSSVHDQRTVTSLPAADGAPQPWAEPFGAPQTGQPLGSFPPPNPATLVGGPPPNPFAPPPEAVPPPPIAPDGPGQAPYGYPGGYGHPGGYGYPSPPPYPYGGGPGLHGWAGAGVGDSNGMGVAGLALGILAAVVFCVWPLSLVLGVLGVVFGALGRRKAGRGEASNPGQALAGIICASVGLVLAVGMGVLTIVAP